MTSSVPANQPSPYLKRTDVIAAIRRLHHRDALEILSALCEHFCTSLAAPPVVPLVFTPDTRREVNGWRNGSRYATVPAARPLPGFDNQYRRRCRTCQGEVRFIIDMRTWSHVDIRYDFSHRPAVIFLDRD